MNRIVLATTGILISSNGLHIHTNGFKKSEMNLLYFYDNDIKLGFIDLDYSKLKYMWEDSHTGEHRRAYRVENKK